MLATLVLRAEESEIKTLPSEWLFDWEKESKKYPVYKLVLVEAQNVVQGLMSIEERRGFVFVSLIENASFNRGVDKIYRGWLSTYLLSPANYQQKKDLEVLLRLKPRVP